MGCNDPTRAPGSCGITTIEVNGVDQSLKRRGYNFVVLNEHTGLFNYHNFIHNANHCGLKCISLSGVPKEGKGGFGLPPTSSSKL